MISHANCDHERTPKARQACRRARELGAETPAKPRTIEFPSDDTGGTLRTRQHRSGDAKRRIRHTLEALERAIDQNNPRRVLVTHAVPGLDINSTTSGEVVEVGEHDLTLVSDNTGFEVPLRYNFIKTIDFV
jgi:hypothetical protein